MDWRSPGSNDKIHAGPADSVWVSPDDHGYAGDFINSGEVSDRSGNDRKKPWQRNKRNR